MTHEEIYNAWAPDDSVWSPWVLPVPFIGLLCHGGGTRIGPPEFRFHLEWLLERDIKETALVVDLPGADAIHYGLALLERGYRPVPVIDGAPAPSQRIVSPHHFPLTSRPALGSAVDMRNLLAALCEGTQFLKTARLDPNAPPAFLLDSNRMSVGAPTDPSVFDNRWMTFPQDFPSARFLLSRGIRTIVFIHEDPVRQPPEDLAHVLLRWQEGGIAMEGKSARTVESPKPMNVSRPSHFRVVWYRALQIMACDEMMPVVLEVIRHRFLAQAKFDSHDCPGRGHRTCTSSIATFLPLVQLVPLLRFDAAVGLAYDFCASTRA